MSQRRQEARRAKQERRRAERRESRVAQRRPVTTAERPHPAAPPPAVAAQRRTRRWMLIGGAIAAVVIVALVVWVVRWVFFTPYPGEKFPSQGNDHLADPSSPHEPYNSNPPTSGWHLSPIPNPGVYTQPRIPEGLGHFMEHGGVWVLYNCPDGCPEEVAELERVVDNALDRGRPVALAPFPSMEARFAAVAWQYNLTMDELDTGKIDNFISRHACRYNPEGGGWCGVRRGSIPTNAQGRTMTAEASPTATPTSVFASPTPAPAAATPTATPAQ